MLYLKILFIFLKGLKTKCMKVGLKWKVSFIIISLVAIGGLFWKPSVDFPNTGDFLGQENVVGSDVAWILACSRTRSSHDSRTFIFLWRNGRKEKYDFHNAPEFYCFGSNLDFMDRCVFFIIVRRFYRFEINGEHYGIIGNPFTYPFFNHVSIYPHKTMASTIPFILFALFQMKFAVITPALITGSFAERVRFIFISFIHGTF